MPTRNVVLTDHQAELIEQLVESGRYQNASEVLREGLRLIERRDKEDEVRLKALRSAVSVGLADLEAGRYTTLETPDALRKHVTALMKRGPARRSK
jgi:antitoxin ParD1/3/4